MKPEIVDTNILLRFLVGDNQAQKDAAQLWFRQAEQGKRILVLTPLVIAEACFVLESFYKQDKNRIADVLQVFLSQSWLHIENRDVLLGVLPWYRKGLHFVDSFLLSWSKKNNGGILTFDKQLAKQKG